MIPLDDATEPDRFGGKAAGLAIAIREGLPVPRGFALDVDCVATLAAGGSVELPEDGFWAVRSSAVGEDAELTSFAGQHLSRINVAAAELRAAVLEVAASALDPAALAYRRRLGVGGRPQMAVVLQRVVRAECAGVLFTRNPTTGVRERAIEASWGLGEAVVAGLVIPDSYRVSADGRVLERRAGHKDVSLVARAEGGVERRAETMARAARLCLDDGRLARLHEVATGVERVFPGDSDLEWAFDDRGVYLLQRRAIGR